MALGGWSSFHVKCVFQPPPPLANRGSPKTCVKGSVFSSQNAMKSTSSASFSIRKMMKSSHPGHFIGQESIIEARNMQEGEINLMQKSGPLT